MSTEVTITLLERIDDLKDKLLTEQAKTAKLDAELIRRGERISNLICERGDLLAQRGILEAEVREMKDVIKELRGDRYDLTQRVIQQSKFSSGYQLQAATYLALLREYQWAGWAYDRGKDGRKILVAGEICLYCKEDKIRGHKLDCAVGDAIKDVD